MDFSTDIPFLAQGLEVSQIGFSGGRIAASLANHGGLTHIDYYGAQRFRDVRFFQADPISAWSHLFRPFLVVNGAAWALEFTGTSIHPAGYTSTCTVGGVTCRHGMWLLNDALVYTFDLPALPAGVTVGIRVMHTDVCARVDKPTRAWQDFAAGEVPGTYIAVAADRYPADQVRQEQARGHATLAQRGTSFTAETAEAETVVGLVASTDLRMRPCTPLFRKFYFDADGGPGQTCIALAFGHQGRAALAARLAALRNDAAGEVARLRADERERRERQPRVSLRSPVVQSLLQNVAPVIDALKVKDLPGAIRAADSGYWVWGWDAMVHADAHGFANDTATLRDLLAFYRRTADPEQGILHAFKIDGRPHVTMAFPAQCLYAVLLYHAYLFTGDDALLAEYLPFARWVAAQAGAGEAGDSGLIRGVSLYPDHPEHLEQDGDDLSVFNNSIYYQALRCLAELAGAAGDTGAAADYDARAARTRRGFARFYDDAQGYFVDSLSARDFSPRRHYPLYAILWVTAFAAELLGERAGEIARFMAANFTARHGLRLLPTWDTRFMYDGCQLGMYMPVVENFHREVQRRASNAASTADMLANMEWFWRQLCIPEALSCEYENHGITVDNPGRKQAFCGKAWLSMFYHVAVGLHLDGHGLVFTPGPGIDLTVRGLMVRGRRLDIAVAGSGPRLAALTLNGARVPPPYRIPFGDLGPHNAIVAEYGPRAP